MFWQLLLHRVVSTCQLSEVVCEAFKNVSLMGNLH